MPLLQDSDDVVDGTDEIALEVEVDTVDRDAEVEVDSDGAVKIIFPRLVSVSETSKIFSNGSVNSLGGRPKACPTVRVLVVVINSTDKTLPKLITPLTPGNKLTSRISDSEKLCFIPPNPPKASGSNHVFCTPPSNSRALSKHAAQAIGFAWLQKIENIWQYNCSNKIIKSRVLVCL